MRGITPDALFKYLKELINTERVQALLHTIKRHKIFKPIFKIVPTCGARWGGMCYGANTIEVSSWILKDASVAKGVVRHELAHAIQDFLNIDGRSHGKEFIQMLKAISPRNWRRDRHWHSTPAIQIARMKIHPKGGRKTIKPLTEYRTFRYAVTPISVVV